MMRLVAVAVILLASASITFGQAAGGGVPGAASGGGTVTGVTATSPVTSTGGTAPVIACTTCGVTSSPLNQFAATTSAQLASILSDETGSGKAVFANASTIAPASIDQAIYFADQFAGADMGAKINTAIAACSGANSCRVMIPAGFYVEATPVVLPQSVDLEGVGPESSWMQYTGTGAAFTLSGADAQIKNMVIQCTVACTYLVNMTGGSTVADNLIVQGGTSATTFFGIHGPNGRISNIIGSNISGTLYECDNAVNNFINNSQTFGVSANTTAIVVDMNSGCNNLQIIGLQHSYSGLHGFIMRNTLTGGVPTGAFFSNFVTDQSAGGSMWVFDSTLGAASDNFVHIVNGFAGSAGQTGTTITTATAIGIDIEGGRNLSFDNLNVIDSAATGVLINNAQVANVKITNSFINNNNRNNTASTNGITVSAAMSGLLLTGITSGNLTGDNTGNQKLGLGITASATAVSIFDNDFNNNATAPLSISSLTSGNYSMGGNLPATDPVAGIATAAIFSSNGSAPTYTPGTGITSVVCASGHTCTQSRGELTITNTSATTGTIATLNFATTLASVPECWVDQNGGLVFLGLGHGTPMASAFTITSAVGLTVSGITTLTVDYGCQL